MKQQDVLHVDLGAAVFDDLDDLGGVRQIGLGQLVAGAHGRGLDGALRRGQRVRRLSIALRQRCVRRIQWPKHKHVPASLICATCNARSHGVGGCGPGSQISGG